MKALKIVLLIIAIAIAGFLSIGWLNPSYTIEKEVVIDAPIEHCWQVFQDTTVMADWVPGMQYMKLTDGVHNKVGAQYEIKIGLDEQAQIMMHELTQVEAPITYCYVGYHDMADFDVCHRFEAQGAKTLTTMSHTIKAKGVFTKALFFLMRDMVAAQDESILNSLKSVIEAEPLPVAPTMDEIQNDTL